MKSKLPAFRSFKYNDSNFRVLDRNGEPWFVHNEVCKHLGIVNASDAASRLDDDEKDAIGITDIHDGSIVAPRSAVQRTTIINESGLYSLILRSIKPEAKEFKKWVTSEVLPSIRKTGAYGKEWLEVRKRGVPVRKDFTGELAPRVAEWSRWGVKHCTDDINVEIVGGTAVVVRKERGLKELENLRDNMSRLELTMTSMTEELAREALVDEDAYGKECRIICKDTAKGVRLAVEGIRNSRKKIENHPQP